MVKRASLALGALALLLGSAACAAVLGFERLAEGDAGIDAAGVDVATATDAEVVPTCAEGRPPGPPASGAVGANIVDGGWDGAPLYVAANRIDFGMDRARPGLNLDLACTNTRETSSCVFDGADDDFLDAVMDVDGGVDSTTSLLFNRVAALGFVAIKPDEINKRLQEARYGLVFEIKDWNGTDSDDDVVLTLFPALGVWQDAGSGLQEPGGPPNVPPFEGFNRSNEWMRDTRYAKSDVNRLGSKLAYVAGGKLVARFDAVDVPFRVPYDLKLFDVKLRDAYVVADVAMTADGPKLTGGVIGGRWPVRALLTEVEKMYINELNELQKTYVCSSAGKGLYLQVWAGACNVTDIANDANQDRKAGTKCDAISVGIGFDTYAVDKAGGTYDQDERFLAAGQLKPNDRCDGGANGDDCPVSK